MKICLFDPGIEDNNGKPSSNLGDLIIQEAVMRELKDIFGNSPIEKISTQSKIDNDGCKKIQTSDLCFVGGTNLLSSNMDKYNQWKISLFDTFVMRNAILLGVGWWQYQDSPNLYTRFLLKSALSNSYLHSVRDSYTKAKLASIGITNVINTGCPTMWSLSQIKIDQIPRNKSENALLMLTDYSKNLDLDKKLIELLLSKYEEVFVWPQGSQDLEYIKSLNVSLTILDRSLDALDAFLKSDIQFDYIGTRLHGGIRCLLSNRRSLILEIDNRAKEIASDTGLTTVPRNDLTYISQWIEKSSETKIRIDTSSINKWKEQFKMIYEIS
ncbi:polysaccharide pyruvyl transferase family protein [Pseudanabaena sp. FACHB-1998]|uniref:polysaccharide pyruvyl transferase family protein n=1 Tax=Pseudanabaena sp. FACHB-1998 TaxID=2692858 RepID=UPI0016813E0F|nr:polysaccharide pyruvyl transferase family protein [Pseudanabaena sp. FACHB-1998]MBD2176643.1 polysaccharide pyruvyl transferase family protein [Pseudanabaena sp. FACHB-1998]